MKKKSNHRGSLMITILIIGFFIFSISGTDLSAERKAESASHKGKLIQMFKSGGYTYLEYESEGKNFWAASKMVVANVGNIIEFNDPLVMKDFYSKTLKRKFELIYFAGMVRAVGKTGLQPMNSMKSMMRHNKTSSDKKVIIVKPGSVKKADNGYTIAECYSQKEKLKGKTILIRARVVKFTSNVKGTNWVHIRDGSGKSGSNDIALTTKKTLIPGDLILVKGTLTLNKDIGSGYLFPLFMEDPEVIQEKK